MHTGHETRNERKLALDSIGLADYIFCLLAAETKCCLCMLYYHIYMRVRRMHAY